ncbi:MAG: hypothetical protein HW398_495 [Acidobacteria bacterium]|nr:hypothetical protein [Acidobacteriota bacterium]
MDPAQIIQIMETGARQYFNGLIQEVRSNLGTTHYRRLSNEELARRMTAIYRNLANWLNTRDQSAVRAAGEGLGKSRFEEGIPLGQVVLSLILEEKYLRKYFADQGESLEEEWSQTVSEYFQKMTYYTAQGYEVALAQSNRFAQGAPATGESQERTAPPQSDGDPQISRGGEIGEVAG